MEAHNTSSCNAAKRSIQQIHNCHNPFLSQFSKKGKIRNWTEILKSSVFKLLFNIEITKAILSEFGIKASSKEPFTISVLTGSKLGKHSVRTRSWQWIKSTLEDLVKVAMKSTEILRKVAHLRG